MNTFRAIIDLWPSLGEFAADAGVAYNTAKQWRTRDSIPSAYWITVVDAAKARAIGGVTLECLGRLAAATTRRTESEKAA